MTIILSYICFKLSWSATAISLIVSYYYYYSTANRGAEYCKKHVCVFVCSQSYLQNYASNLRWIFVHVTYGRGSVLLWRRNDTLRISGFVDDVIFAHKLRLLDVATRLRQWGSHAAWAWRIDTCCRQRTLGTTSWRVLKVTPRWRHRGWNLQSVTASL